MNDRSQSPWNVDAPVRDRSPLDRDLTADVCVVGAGIAGISTAYALSREGRRVVVVDDGPIGGGETSQTTAHLSSALDDRYMEVEKIRGEESARLAASSHSAAIDRIEQNVAAERIDCDFTRLSGYLFLGADDRPEMLDEELAAVHRAGLKAVQKLSRTPGSFSPGPCLEFPRQGQFHPLKYLAGLASAIERQGGQIFTGTHAAEIKGGDAAGVTTKSGHRISAAAIVVATNTPVNDLVAVHTKQAAYITYAIGLRIPRGIVERALYWDTLAPYHYVRLHSLPGEEVLIVGGEDHKTGQATDQPARFARLEEWTRARVPQAGNVEFRWSGQVMISGDGLAFIGRNPMDADNVYICTGDSGMGMTHGTIAGTLITDLITKRDNPWTALYDPSRKPIQTARRFVRENVNVAAQYATHVTPGDVDEPGEIPLDSGAVLRRGLVKVAVYRDAEGALHERSAVCPHLRCIVAWNQSDRTWDCPCHGSRFDRFGKVITGPANSDLPQTLGDGAAGISSGR